MPAPFRKVVLVCTNTRPPGNPKGSCGEKGGEAVRDAFKKELSSRGLHHEIRAAGVGCLDACAQGITVVVYPDDVWYAHVTLEDVHELVEQHLVRGQPVERLRLVAEGERERIKLPRS